jgi:hypothetical protein
MHIVSSNNVTIPVNLRAARKLPLTKSRVVKKEKMPKPPDEIDLEGPEFERADPGKKAPKSDKLADVAEVGDLYQWGKSPTPKNTHRTIHSSASTLSKLRPDSFLAPLRSPCVIRALRQLEDAKGTPRQGDDKSEVWTCGQNSYGELGHNDASPRKVFTVVEALIGKDVRGIAAGNEHKCIVTSEGDVWSAGAPHPRLTILYLDADWAETERD